MITIRDIQPDIRTDKGRATSHDRVRRVPHVTCYEAFSDYTFGEYRYSRHYIIPISATDPWGGGAA